MPLYFNPETRALEKQAARDKDDQDIRDGVKTPEQVQKENSMFGGRKFTVLHMGKPGPLSKDLNPRIGKLNRKMGILKGNEFIYCVPDFLKINNRHELIPLLNEYLQKETIAIKTIMYFESNCKKK